MTLLTNLQAAGLPVVSTNGETQATFSRTLTWAEDEIYFSILDPLRAQRIIDHAANIATIKAEYLATLDMLTTIETTANPSTAQVIAAVKYLAGRQKIIFKLLARMI